MKQHAYRAHAGFACVDAGFIGFKVYRFYGLGFGLRVGWLALG